MSKLFLNKWLLMTILVAFGILGQRYYSHKLRETEAELSVARNNEKAYERSVEIWKDRYGQEHAKSLMFMESIESFKRGNDSTSKRLLELIKQQDIKLSKLERIGYTKTRVETNLSREVNIPVMPDTTLDLSDQWVTNILHLSPVKISSEISFDNETLTTFKVKKELVSTPKKTIVGRFFQNIFGKKHFLIEGETIQTNPLVKTKEQKFIQIVK